jgi:hypothetical protein
MRLSDEEKGQYYKMREVSELRTQYQCEYRLHLKQRLGDSRSQASVDGTELHRQFSLQSDKERFGTSANRIIPLSIIVVTIIAGILWIFW